MASGPDPLPGRDRPAPAAAVLLSERRAASPRPSKLQAAAAHLHSYPLGRVAILAAALGALVAALLPIDPRLNPDSLAFEALARSLLAGDGFVYREPMMPGLPLYAFRAPGYAAFLALGLLFGGTATTVVLQGALNGVTSALVGAITGRLAGARAAWIAFALRLLWPAGWFHSTQLLSEILFEFTTVLAVWLAFRAVNRRHAGWAVASGAVVAVALLTRPVGLGAAVAIAAWLLMRYPRGAAAMALATIIAWSPWPIRNAIRLHAFVPFVTSAGINYWSSNFNRPMSVSWNYMAEHAGMGELGLDRYFRAAALEEARRDPVTVARRVLRGMLSYLGPIRDRSRETWLHRFAMLAALPAILLARWRRRLTPVFLIWVGEGVLLLSLANNPRYRFTAEWCLVVAAAIGLEAARRRWGGRRVAVLAPAALLACIVFTLAVARG